MGMGMYMRVNGKMIKLTVKATIIIQMVPVMRVIGSMINNMVRALKHGQTERNM